MGDFRPTWTKIYEQAVATEQPEGGHDARQGHKGQADGIERQEEEGLNGPDPGEAARVRQVYRGYGEAAAKRRSWSAENPGNRAIRAELARAAFALAGAELTAAHEILDVGCGTGWWLAELDGRPAFKAALHGVELLPERVAAAHARVPAATIATADARSLPYADSRFGAVSLFTLLSSLASRADAERAVAEAVRVLAPGGALLVWEPRLPNPLNRHTLLIDRDTIARAAPRARIAGQATTTVLPPLARRLGRATGRLYPLLARAKPLRTHRLTCLVR